MSEFMRSTQVTNSPRSVGRLGSRMRWTTTPLASSRAGDSSPPRGSTWTSTSRSSIASESLRTWGARPPSISGGYSQERIRTRVIAKRALPLQERSETQVRGERAHARLGGRSAVYGLQQGTVARGRARPPGGVGAGGRGRGAGGPALAPAGGGQRTLDRLVLGQRLRDGQHP